MKSVRSAAASLGRLRFFYAFSLGLLAAFALPAAASATVLPAWGSSLAANSNYDLANGDYTPGAMEGFTDSNPAPGSRTAVINPGDTRDTSYHGGDDAAVWNPGDTAPAGGQVLDIRVKGCAWNDPTADGYPNNELSGGYPVNWVNFQTMSPAGGSYTPTATAAGFPIPFCSNSSNPSTGTVNTSTVSTFQPLHMCVSAGDVIDFADVGGYIPTSHSYPNGVPFLVLAGDGAAPPGSTLNSYVHVTQSGGSYSAASVNFYSEPNEELQLQVIEGTGDDAYALCPGGAANEPSGSSASNQIICVYHSASTEGYPTCNADGVAVYPPAASAPPKISGTAAVNQRLNEAHGTWTNSPYGYKIQWERCDLSGASCSAISGATNGWYYPVSADVGDTLRVEEWATNDANTAGPAVSTPTSVVTAGSSGGGSGSSGGSGGSGSGGSKSGQLILSALRLNPASFFAAKGTTVTYKDNRAAKTTLHIFRLVPGMRRGKACVAIPKKHGHVVKCTRMVAVKTLVHQDKAGGNAVKLRGLKPAKYELEAIATMGSSRSFAIAHFTVKPKRR